MKEELSKNKMGTEPVPKIMLSMGIPMILSMVLQACYNIVDSMFVARIPDSGNIVHAGEYAVNALTLAFPVQMLIVAFGIGTGVGVNALLSRSLGQNDKEKVAHVAGNGVFLGIVIYIMFFILGIVGINIIFGGVSTAAVTAYGIFYKIQQFIFFAGFGLRDAITPIVSFNYGMGNHKRVKQSIKFGILYISIIMLAGTLLLELFAGQLISVFSLSEGTANLCVLAIHVISVGFVFAGANIAIQGVFQGVGNGIGSLVISLLRLFVIVLPLAWLFSTFSNALFWIWFTFPIAEIVAFFVAAILLIGVNRKGFQAVVD